MSGLTNMLVFNDFTYSAMTEVLQQQVDKFNAASNSALMLSSKPTTGDYDLTAYWQLINNGNLVRRRNAYGNATVAGTDLAMIENVSVKVAAGTPPLDVSPGQLRWLQQDPEKLSAVIGQQLAVATMADMLNIGLGSLVAALANAAGTNGYDITSSGEAIAYPAGTQTLYTANAISLMQTKMLLGDMSERVGCWIMHSIPFAALRRERLVNAARLFQFGNITVSQDEDGTRYVVTDSPNLVVTGSPNHYYTLGLQPGALTIAQNADFDAMFQEIVGQDNLVRKYQAEWSYNLSVRGFKWDIGNGGHSPTNATLLTSANWDQVSTSYKDLAGVYLLSK
jgi:Major capsid protein 13-like